METLLLEAKSVNVLEGDYTHSNDWGSKLFESNVMSEKDNWIMFESNGFEVLVDFDLEVTGNLEFVREDEMTPDYFEENIESIEINIKSVEIDGYGVSITSELNENLTNLIKKII